MHFDLDIYCMYEVEYTWHSCSITDRICDEYIFGNDSGAQKFKVNGIQLIDMLCKQLKDEHFCSIEINENVIIIENFNPCNGETCNYTYVIKCIGGV